MITEKMNVHRALSELKILDARIAVATASGVFCVPNKHSNDKIEGVSADEYKESMKANWSKINDLIRRRKAIKKAVVLSNAVTKVNVAGTEYTVAEAIEMKNHGLDGEKALFSKLKHSLKTAVDMIEEKNGAWLEQRLERYISSLYGEKDKKTNLEEIKKAEAEFVKANTYELVDAIDIKKQIEDLESKISAFEAEVDAVLSSSNAITEIEISY